MDDRRPGFTLLELAVVIGIIALLVSVLSVGIVGYLSVAKTQRAVRDTEMLRQSIFALIQDTGLGPFQPTANLKIAPGCTSNTKIPIRNLMNDGSGMVTATNYPPPTGISGWRGPYLAPGGAGSPTQAPLDPWGNDYVLDYCYQYAPNNAPLARSLAAVVVVSYGPNADPTAPAQHIRAYLTGAPVTAIDGGSLGGSPYPGDYCDSRMAGVCSRLPPPGPCSTGPGYCDTTSFRCIWPPAPAGPPGSCDDGNPCTTGDHCDGLGRCVGTPSSSGVCALSCPSGQHACSGACVDSCSTATCGTSCSPCPSDPHGVSICSTCSACTKTCSAGYPLCPLTGMCQQCCYNADCGPGGVCLGGSCNCPTGKKLCQGSCIPASSCCTAADCAPGQVCTGGRCGACPLGQRSCGSTCVPLAGCCTNADCPAGAACAGGMCQCPSGQTLCNGACITTGLHCDCPPGDIVCNTSCQPPTSTCACPSGSYPCHGTCISSTQPCTCPYPDTLCNGSCLGFGEICVCPAGTRYCNSQCISSSQPCGCPSGQQACNGICIPSSTSCNCGMDPWGNPMRNCQGSCISAFATCNPPCPAGETLCPNGDCAGIGVACCGAGQRLCQQQTGSTNLCVAARQPCPAGYF